MCLIVHSQGHITIKMLNEQFTPILREKHVDYLECFDLVLRNNGGRPLEELYLLSPQRALNRRGDLQPIFELIPPDAALLRFPTPSYDQRGEMHRLRFSGGAPGAETKFEVTRLEPIIEPPGWFNDPNYELARITLQQAQMTMAVVRFAGAAIEPYDPSRETETTYWIRLIIMPRVHHIVATPIPVEAVRSARDLFLQPCIAMGPNAVLDLFADKLKYLEVSDGNMPEEARILGELVLDGVFRKPNTSTRVEDHQLSLITVPQFLVLNPHVDGQCGLIGVEPFRSQPTAIARRWFTGANNYPTSDPLSLARIVYLYLREWALNPNDGKTKEQISSAIAPEHHGNVSHVVEAMDKLGLLESHDAGYYNVKKPTLRDGSLFLAQTQRPEEIQLGERAEEIRNALYGQIFLKSCAGKPSFFTPKSFRIHFDLLFSGEDQHAE